MGENVLIRENKNYEGLGEGRNELYLFYSLKFFLYDSVVGKLLGSHFDRQLQYGWGRIQASDDRRLPS